MSMTPEQAILAYIRAKDGNRPHLLDTAFVEDVVLQMVVQTDQIGFPPALEGRVPIARTLVADFNRTYENIYTLCLCPPPEAARARAFSCDWLVAMSEKDGGAVRLGCGRYDWSFEPSTGQVRSLRITIAQMDRLPPDALPYVMGWVEALPYPWCEAAQARQAAPAVVLERLAVLS